MRTVRVLGPLAMLVAVVVCLAAGEAVAAPATVSIVSVTVTSPPHQRDGGVLTPGRQSVVFTPGSVGLRVLVHNAGAAARGVPVRLVIDRGGDGAPIVKAVTIASLGAGATAAVSFSAVAKLPLVTPTTLSLQAAAAAPRLYPVVFTPLD